MTIHEPAEKNLKHKTDVMSWADVPWDDCDLNFRPPSLSRLSLSVGAAYGQLLIVASITVGSVAALNRWLVPTIMVETSWMEICVVAVVVSLLSTAGWYRPLPRVFGAQDTAGAGLSVAISVLGFYAIIRLSYGYGLFDVGVVLLFVVAIPSCLLFADQLTGHMLHWWSADPKMSRNTMVVWRNAWCGRFMTQHVEELVALGVHQEQVAVLKRYWMGHVVIIVVYAISTLVSLLIGIGEVGLVFLIASTVLLLLVSAWADWQSLGCRQHLAHVLGHWFLYLKDSAQPAWVMQSPAGPQLIRAFQSYAAVSFLAIAFWKLGLAIASTPTQALNASGIGTATEGVLIGGGAILLAPLHCLLICFVVSAPALSSVEAGLFCDDQPGDSR